MTIAQRQKVLIVDDEPKNQRIIKETLEDLVSYETASSGEEALKIVESYLPDIVLLDIMMRGMSGYEVCKQIRNNKKLASVKVILVSGKAMLEERLEGYAVGADDYITKPFVPEELFAKAKVFLKLCASEKQLAILNQSLEDRVKERTRQLIETKAKLISSAKMAALGEMAGGIAHEINTPLATIGMLSEQIGEIITEDPIDQNAVLKMTQSITQTVKRIDSIIRGLRTFSRDGSQDHFDHVPLKKILQETLVLCSERIKISGVQLRIKPMNDDLIIRCRSVQISQVLLNLINNSCDAISKLPEKWIEIDAQKIEQNIQISVTDSGHGIPEEIREKIFQPFFTTKDTDKGTGLGLSVSKGIIDAHLGTIAVDTACPNSRFLICLPAGHTSRDDQRST